MIRSGDALAARPAQGSRVAARDVALLATGAVVVLLLVAFVLLYANFPTGYDVPYSLAFKPVSLFRALWPYPSLQIAPGTFQLLSLLVIAGLWAAYLAGAWLLWPRRRALLDRRLLWAVLTVVVLSQILLVLFLPPVLSSDVYDYGFYGRLVTRHGLNPYVAAGQSVQDPIVPLMGWPDRTSDYPPAWTALSAAATLSAGSDLAITGMAFKALAALFNSLALAMVFLLTRRLNGENGLLPLLLYGWNPLILVETAGTGHNDVAMLALALLGLWLSVRGRRLAGVAVLLLSVYIKFLSLVVLFFVALRELADERTWRRAARLALGMVLVGIGVSALLYWPFVRGLNGQAALVGSAPASSNAATNILVALPRDWIAAYLNGHGYPASIAAVEAGMGRVLQILFVFLLLYLGWRTLRGERDWSRIIQYSTASSLIYLVLVFGGDYPWYMITPIGLAVAGPATRGNARLLAICLVLGCAAMLRYAVIVAL